MNGQLRAAARAALPEGAFLRRDRGEALFVTDAPRLGSGDGWRERLAEAGFLVAEANGLARLSPGEKWLRALEARFPEPPNPLCAGMKRFAGQAIEPESLALFALGVKALENPEDAERFDRRLRQRAAECLRLNAALSRAKAASSPISNAPLYGGGLYACALLTTHMKEAIP